MCDERSALAFLHSIPTYVSSASSPWISYLQAVYAGLVQLPFRLADLTFFYHHDAEWRQRWPNIEWPMSTCAVVPSTTGKENRTRAPWLCGNPPCDIHHSELLRAVGPRCAPEVCRPWMQGNSSRSGSQHGRANSVLATRTGAHQLYIYQSANRTTYGTVTTRGANLARLSQRASASGEWTEVMRASRGTEGRSGAGCWFHYARGRCAAIRPVHAREMLDMRCALEVRGVLCASCVLAVCCSSPAPPMQHQCLHSTTLHSTLVRARFTAAFGSTWANARGSHAPRRTYSVAVAPTNPSWMIG